MSGSLEWSGGGGGTCGSGCEAVVVVVGIVDIEEVVAVGGARVLWGDGLVVGSLVVGGGGGGIMARPSCWSWCAGTIMGLVCRDTDARVGSTGDGLAADMPPRGIDAVGVEVVVVVVGRGVWSDEVVGDVLRCVGVGVVMVEVAVVGVVDVGVLVVGGKSTTEEGESFLLDSGLVVVAVVDAVGATCGGSWTGTAAEAVFVVSEP